ncbi:hypothetical protein [Salinibacter ruber]|jgi:hypothetical protein|uniref:hypothetical protein n=1 Tax=Salinibacter ruber TaxID=146919 RepID=UPI002169EB2E|nr:hypothetical protein [Salinibacter ruber]MCS4039267.1 hypothetical protein [Salinibacter ruber]
MSKDYLQRSIYNLVFHRRSTIEDTSYFRDKKHNDHLVPELDSTLENIIFHFDKFHKVTYDIQGLLDRGVDVVAQYEVEGVNESPNRIGFQVKSYDDLEKEGWLTKLKSQMFEALERTNLKDLYVMLCTDVNRHLDKIRFVNSEVEGRSNLYAVRPEFAYTLLKLNSGRIASKIKNDVSKEDVVLKEANKKLAYNNIHQSAILIDVIVEILLYGNNDYSVGSVEESEFIRQIYDSVPYLSLSELEEEDEPNSAQTRSQEKVIHQDIDTLESSMIKIDRETQKISLFQEQFAAVGAIALESVSRYGYGSLEAKNYLLHTLKESQLETALSLKK